MSPRTKDLLGWAGVVLVGVVAFWATRPAPPPLPPGPTPPPPPSPVKADPGTGKVSFGAMLKPVPDGLVIAELYAPSSAERAGLRPGDVILQVDGRVADTTKVLTDRLDGLRPGETLVLRVRRGDGGAEEDVRVELAADATFERGLAARLIAQAVEQLVSLERPDGLWPHYQDARNGRT